MSNRFGTMGAGVAMVLSAGAARAQTAEALWTWQVSSDGGSTWRDGSVEVSTTQPSVRVRCLIDWVDPDAVTYAFARVSSFDAIVAGMDGAGPGDRVENYARPYPLDRGARQTIVATRFGNTIKMDDSRDTFAPGVWTRGVFPAQLVENYSEGHFTRAKPISVFEYDLVLDGTLGVRRITDLPVLPSSAGCAPLRYVGAFTSPEGAQRSYMFEPICTGRDEIRWSSAELVVVECRADFNADRQIDFFDYLDFIAAFDAGCE